MKKLWMSGVAACVLALGACGTKETPKDEIPPAEEAVTEDAEADAALPEADIYVAPLFATPAGISIGPIRNVTNRPGYDNQPSFLADSNAFYYSRSSEDGSQMDIWLNILDMPTDMQITSTPDVNEFSPREEAAGQTLTYVQQDAATGENIHVRRLNITDNSSERLIEIDPTGYYAFGDDGKIAAVFSFTDNPDIPPTLKLVDLETQAVTQIASEIGRGIVSAPDGDDIFFTVFDGDSAVIKRLELPERTVTDLFALPGTSEDYVVFRLPGDEGYTFLSASDGQLFIRRESGSSWDAAAELDVPGEVGRLAVSPNLEHIAMVVTTVVEEPTNAEED